MQNGDLDHKFLNYVSVEMSALRRGICIHGNLVLSQAVRFTFRSKMDPQGAPIPQSSSYSGTTK